MGGFCIQLMSDHPARRGPGSVLDQVPLPVDVSAGLSFTGRDPAPRKWSPLTGAELGRQHSANHIYLFIRTTLERLIVFSFWTQPFANESLIGTDRAQNHERVINKKERRETRETILETQVDIRQHEWGFICPLWTPSHPSCWSLCILIPCTSLISPPPSRHPSIYLSRNPWEAQGSRGKAARGKRGAAHTY